VISAEHGKTHDDAKGGVTRGLEVVEFQSARRTYRRAR
jgi:malonate-semialdehyde dehydrogenase (acetylating) / methylmalonate-semialdehyde dehydrogenase